MHSHSIKNEKNSYMHFIIHLTKLKKKTHICIHSIKKMEKYIFHTYILMPLFQAYIRALSLYSCIFYKKKKPRVAKMKNITYIRAFMHSPHFLQDLFWDPLDVVMVSTSLFFFKIWLETLLALSRSWPHYIKTRTDKIIS